MEEPGLGPFLARVPFFHWPRMFLVLEVLVFVDLLAVVPKSSESGPGRSRFGGALPLDVMGTFSPVFTLSGDVLVDGWPSVC